MKKETYSVILKKDAFVFSSAHFMTFDDEVRESMHGHNFKLTVEIESKKLENSMVIDFLIVENWILEIIKELKDKIIIARDDKNLKIEIKNEQISVIHAKDLFVFPKKDCAVLPMSNSSTELLAEYIGKKLKSNMREKMTLKVSVEEAVGCIGSYWLKEE